MIFVCFQSSYFENIFVFCLYVCSDAAAALKYRNNVLMAQQEAQCQSSGGRHEPGAPVAVRMELLTRPGGAFAFKGSGEYLKGR